MRQKVYSMHAPDKISLSIKSYKKAKSLQINHVQVRDEAPPDFMLPVNRSYSFFIDDKISELLIGNLTYSITNNMLCLGSSNKTVILARHAGKIC